MHQSIGFQVKGGINEAGFLFGCFAYISGTNIYKFLANDNTRFTELSHISDEFLFDNTDLLQQ